MTEDSMQNTTEILTFQQLVAHHGGAAAIADHFVNIGTIQPSEREILRKRLDRVGCRDRGLKAALWVALAREWKCSDAQYRAVSEHFAAQSRAF